MRALDRKLLRDLRQLAGQAAAIALVVAVGVAMFAMYFSTFESLGRTRDSYYDRYRLADVFVTLGRAPMALVGRVAAIPGVEKVEARTVVQVTLDLEDLPEPAVGRLVSIPETPRPMLNDLYLAEGRYPRADEPDEVLASEAFARANSLRPGDRLGALVNGRRRELRICGLALSPEFVYAIRPGDLLPDDRRFGILWMGRRALASAFDMEGGFNDLALTLARGARPEPVIEALDRLLEPYGGRGAVPRSLQTSAWFVENEMVELRTMGSALPALFLAVSAFLLHVVLGRMIAVQRPQLAALKALGYSNAAVAWHYSKLALLVGSVGSLAGLTAGARLGLGMTRIYNTYFRFPLFEYVLSPRIGLAGAAVALAAALLGALAAVRSAVVLPPAEAMRPEPPATYRRTLVERLGLAPLLGEPVRMILRNLSRHPLRTLLSATGMAAALGLLVMGFFFQDALQVLVEGQFERVMRQDVTATFVEPTSGRVRHELERLPGVLYSEPFRAVSARLRAGPRSRQVAILGLEAQPRLHRVVGHESGVVTLPPHGIVLASMLAESLGLAVGDPLRVEVLEGARPSADLEVAAVVDEYMGMGAYMEISALQRLLREGEVFSGAFLAVDDGRLDELYRELKRTPRLASVALTQAAYEGFRSTLGRTLRLMMRFNLAFAAVIACGVIYNAARISLSERERDLASLRVLGFTRGEISFILLGELALVTLTAIPIGLVLGNAMCRGILAVLATELLRIPLVIKPASYAVAALVVTTAATISGLVVRRRLDRLDLVAVLKARE